jgi:formate dehydrogenase alpha subunit
MKITIDNKEIEVEGRKTILEVAREKEIFIPSLCDHSRLTPFTGCRLCIVEIKGRRGYPPSCGTYVEDGMEVRTKTPRIQELRRQIMELILSEHPNACLICSEKDQCDEYKSTIRKVGETTGCVLCSNNGRCELQDVVEALNIKEMSLPSLYRNFEIRKDDPFFDRNYNLCILCGRCVRICHEVRGASTISFIYRGTEAVVSTVLDRTLLDSGCQFCGACVDVCPTGALAERAVRPEGLPDKTVKTICPLCSIGCELDMELKGSRILRSVPSAEGAANHGQACVKGRFTMKDLVYSPQRIVKPLIRKKGELEEVDWEEALDFVARKLRKYKGNEMAVISSPQATNEESYLFQKFALQGLKTKNIDSTARYSPLACYWDWAQEKGLAPRLNFKAKDISQAKTILLLGADLTVSHPVLGLSVIEAVKNGAKLIIVDPREICLSRYSSQWLRIKPGTDFYFLNSLSRMLLDEEQSKDTSKIKGFESFKKSLDEMDMTKCSEITGISEEDLKTTSRIMLEEGTAVFLFGLGLTQHPSAKDNLTALWNLSLFCKAQLYPLGLENNSRGELEIRRSFKAGLSFNQVSQAVKKKSIKALYLAGPFPSLEKSKPGFLVIQDSFVSENMKLADAVLPGTTFAETEGTYSNLEGRIQKLNRVIEPLGEAKPDWWIISQLAQSMGYEGFAYKRPSQILKEMKKIVPGFAAVSDSLFEKGNEMFIQEGKEEKGKFIPLEYKLPSSKVRKEFPFHLLLDYSLDYYRSLGLSQEIKGMRIIRDSRWIRINPEDAEKLKLNEGEEVQIGSGSKKIKGVARISDTIPRGILVASFLLNEKADFSAFHISSGHDSDSFPLKMLPVKIYRGK